MASRRASSMAAARSRSKEIVVDCPAGGAPFALEVYEGAEEQSHFLSCPSCGRALEVFVRCQSGEVLSISASVDTS